MQGGCVLWHAPPPGLCTCVHTSAGMPGACARRLPSSSAPAGPASAPLPQKRRWGLLASQVRDKGMHPKLDALGAELASRLAVIRANPGDTVVAAGDHAKGVFFVRVGRAKVSAVAKVMVEPPDIVVGPDDLVRQVRTLPPLQVHRRQVLHLADHAHLPVGELLPLQEIAGRAGIEHPRAPRHVRVLRRRQAVRLPQRLHPGVPGERAVRHARRGEETVGHHRAVVELLRGLRSSPKQPMIGLFLHRQQKKILQYWL